MNIVKVKYYTDQNTLLSIKKKTTKKKIVLKFVVSTKILNQQTTRQRLNNQFVYLIQVQASLGKKI